MQTAAGMNTFLRRWFLRVTLAESVGYLAPAFAGVFASLGGASAWTEVAVMAVAGAFEGACLGAGQAWALDGVVPVRRGPYVLGTALAASAVWTFVMATIALSTVEGPPLWLLPLGVPALLSIGAAQAWVLRGELPNPTRWIGWTALAWILALPMSFTPGPLVDETTPLPVHLVLWPLGGVLMAAVMAVVTGLGMKRMLGERARLG